MTAKTRLAAVWFAMVVATAASLFTSHEASTADGLAAAAILAFAYVKCRLVVMQFMEVSHAPTGWRLFFEGWMALVVLAILFFRLPFPAG